MKRKIAFLLALLMAASILAGCGGNKTWTGKHEVEITVNNYGTIRLEVDADSAPKTASQFLNLAKKGFYNNLTIYRVIDGFAIYGGCPNKNGTGKASTTVEGEFTSNGFNNPLSMTRSAIGMARGTDKNSLPVLYPAERRDVSRRRFRRVRLRRERHGHCGPDRRERAGHRRGRLHRRSEPAGHYERQGIRLRRIKQPADALRSRGLFIFGRSTVF